MKQRYGDIPVKAVVLSDESTDIVPYVDEVVDDASPDVWLNLLVHSKAVYTDSFHGVIFSLKYHKPFIAYYKEATRSTRLIDLKERFGLVGNIVSSVDGIDLSSDIRYNKLQPQMDAWKAESLNAAVAAAVLCGMGEAFFSPTGGWDSLSLFSVCGAAVSPFPQTTVLLSARSGLFFCPGRIAFGKERAYDQKL